MSDPVTSPSHVAEWSASQLDLWQRIREHDFDENAPVTFAYRVAKQAKLSTVKVEAAIAEYRRFCFLAVCADHPVTPSAIVDEIWHTHLVDTRRYQSFCLRVLRYKLDHKPSLGGRDEDSRHLAQYEDTLSSYRRFFGEPSPEFWPTPSPAPKNANTNVQEPALHPGEPTTSVMPPSVSATLISAVATYAVIALIHKQANPFAWETSFFLLWYLALLFLSVSISSWIWRKSMDRGDRGKRAAEPWEVAYLVGGKERVAETLIAALLLRDAVRLHFDRSHVPDPYQNRYVWLLAGDLTGDELLALPPILSEALEVVRAEKQLYNAIVALELRHANLGDDLRDLGLLASSEQCSIAMPRSSVPSVLLAAFGWVKLSLGTPGDVSIFFLGVLIVVAFVTKTKYRKVEEPLTRAGELEIDRAIQRCSDNPGDVVTRIALSGTVALVGTQLVDYHYFRLPGGGGAHYEVTFNTCGG